MKVTRFEGTIVEVETYFNYAGEHEEIYHTFSVDEMPPMDNELYEEYKAEIVRQVKENLSSTQEIVDKIYFNGFEDSPIYEKMTMEKHHRIKSVWLMDDDDDDVIYMEDYIEELKAGGLTFEQIEEIQARVACGETLDSAMQSV